MHPNRFDPTDSERQLVQTPETQLLGVKDMLEGGTFHSSQYIDLLPQAYPPVEDVVMQEALSPAVIGPGPPEVPPDLEAAAEAGPASNVEGNAPVAPAIPPAAPEAPYVIEDVHDKESEPKIDKSPMDVDQQVQADADDPPERGEPSSSSRVRSFPAESSTYGPMRKMRTKSGPLTLHRPLAMQQDDFVEVMREVVPSLIGSAAQGAKREAETAPESDRASKVPKGTEDENLVVQPQCIEQFSAQCTTSEQLAVQALAKTPSDELDMHDVVALVEAMEQGEPMEVLIAQYYQKKMHKELPHSNNPPWLQARIDAAKVAEWNTLSAKPSVRLVPGKEATRIKNHMSNRIMGSRFVLTKKPEEAIIENGLSPDPNNPEHWKVKARWCLQGHLDPDLTSKAESGMLQSPTLSQMGRTVLFQLMSSYKWDMQLGDVKGAFLESGSLDPKYKPLYAWLPPGGIPGAPADQLVEVLGNVYGQNDAPAAWYKVFDGEVIKSGFTRSRYDPCLYFIHDKAGKLCGLLGSHVDDTVTGGSGEVYETALRCLKQRFPYRKWRVQEGEFCGAHYKQCPKTKEITMSQELFCESLTNPLTCQLLDEVIVQQPWIPKK